LYDLDSKRHFESLVVQHTSMKRYKSTNVTKILDEERQKTVNDVTIYNYIIVNFVS